ncbi:BgTH12-01361 [Blumeria graminis f. sp. triticale]|uniref:BgTH12-01361 n=1 Tax=Blumeria graminis f. sp. triticale TaxID=1689686 RepID=A0A9W4D365_BLUGR|nr:BgTH12-01361 [Blumeria graminis f. sp. triticale]
MTAALRNELYKNVIVDLDNFWTELFLGKDWSNQTWNIWKSYEAYERNEIKIQEEAETWTQRETINNKQKVTQEETPKTFRKPRSQTKKDDKESAILAGNKSLEGSQNIMNTNNNDIQNKTNSEEAKSGGIQKIIYKNKILTGDMTVDEMWDWLNFFRENFLNQLTDKFHRPSEKFPKIIKEEEGSQFRCSYFRSSDKCPMRGTDNDYQADFLTKRNGSSNAQSKMWHTDKIQSNYDIKQAAISRFKEKILDNFSTNFVVFKALASELRTILFGELGDEYSAPEDYEAEYEKIIKAFSNTIEDLRGKINQLLHNYYTITVPLNESLANILNYLDGTIENKLLARGTS